MIHIVAGPKTVLIVGLVNASEMAGKGVRSGELQMTESDRRMICRRGSRGGAPRVRDPLGAGLLSEIFG